MKHNDWTEQMRRRLGNAEADVPDGLWDAIEQKLDAQLTAAPSVSITEEKAEPVSRRVVLRRWAVAASVALVAGAALWWQSASEDSQLPGGAKKLGVVAYDNADPHNGSSANGSSVANGYGTNGCADNGAETNGCPTACSRTGGHKQGHTSGADAAAFKGDYALRADGGADETMVSTTSSDDTRTAIAANDTDDADVNDCNNGTGGNKSQGSSESKADVKHDNGKRQPTTAMLRSEKYGSHSSHRATAGGSRWQLAAGTSGNMTRYSSTGGIMPVSYSAPSFSEATNNMLFCAEPMQRDCKEKTRHNMPVSFGATVAYRLTDRLAISTGAVYTLATSSFEHGASNNVTKDDQTLHYIGIPLNASYTVWGNRLLKAYVTAGGQADFNVAAKVETGGHTTDTGKDRVQFSVGGAAGLQVNVIRQIGIYVEPGVKYYFDNGSTVQNVFKEHPCNFSLQVGLRYDIK